MSMLTDNPRVALSSLANRTEDFIEPIFGRYKPLNGSLYLISLSHSVVSAYLFISIK